MFPMKNFRGKRQGKAKKKKRFTRKVRIEVISEGDGGVIGRGRERSARVADSALFHDLQTCMDIRFMINQFLHFCFCIVQNVGYMG